MYSKDSLAFYWVVLGITLLVLAVLWLPGFGFSSRMSRRVLLTGQVTYNGRPVTDGAIVLKPNDGMNEEWGAATLDPDGSFKLECMPGRDELRPGRYGVFFVFNGASPGGSEHGQGGSAPGGAANDDGSAVPKSVPPPIPSKYTKGDTSGLWINLGKEPNHIAIELKD